MAYITMNRFQVRKGQEKEFESVWLSRDIHLRTVPGFKEFHLLKGPERDDHILYASHTVWADEGAFVAWTRSEAFRKAHAGAGGNKGLYLGHPELEAFSSIQNVSAET
ncbi:MAG: antibiotic biosynthesis monooxygenase [Pseudomonadota bacterium]